MENKIKSIGEERVRIDFNPEANSDVDQIKQKAAELINLIFKVGNDGRLSSLAATAFEEGAMWAVKSATAPKPTPGVTCSPVGVLNNNLGPKA